MSRLFHSTVVDSQWVFEKKKWFLFKSIYYKNVPLCRSKIDIHFCINNEKKNDDALQTVTGFSGILDLNRANLFTYNILLTPVLYISDFSFWWKELLCQIWHHHNLDEFWWLNYALNAGEKDIKVPVIIFWLWPTWFWFSISAFQKRIIALKYTSSVIRQKGESQNGGFKKTKHAKSSEKRTFLKEGKKCSFFE